MMRAPFHSSSLVMPVNVKSLDFHAFLVTLPWREVLSMGRPRTLPLPADLAKARAAPPRFSRGFALKSIFPFAII